MKERKDKFLIARVSESLKKKLVRESRKKTISISKLLREILVAYFK